MKQISWKNKTILAVNAHPDDIDFGAGGTIAKAVRSGAVAYYAVFTNGSRGNAGNPKLKGKVLIETRVKEQRAAARVLGVKNVFFLGVDDCELEATEGAKKKLVRIMRKVKPDVVIGLDPTRFYSPSGNFIHHKDHRAAGEITVDAVYPLCGDVLFFPELGEPHKVSYLLLVTPDDANYSENIASTISTKIKALGEHRSQIKDMKDMQKWVSQLSRMWGKRSNIKYAELFRLVSL